MVELLYGERRAGQVPGGTLPLDLGLVDDVVLPDVDIYYCLFEIPMAVAIPRLPLSVHPSVPAHMGISFWRAKASPVGPFEFAYLGIACRTGIKPRHFVFSAYTNNSMAATFFGERYGIECAIAQVEFKETYDRYMGRIERDGRALLEIVVTNMVALVGASARVKYSPAISVTRCEDGRALAQFEASYDFKRVMRGEARAQTYLAEALGDADVSPVYPMSGTLATCDVTLHPARFLIDLETPAENGGARKIAR